MSAEPRTSQVAEPFAGRRRARRLLWILAVTLALYTTRPMPNHLVWCTTPALNADGDRVRLLVPAGWVVSQDVTSLLISGVMLEPPGPLPWLHRFGIKFHVDESSSLLIEANPNGSPSALPEFYICDTKEGKAFRYAWAVSSPNSRRYVVAYTRRDKHDLDATLPAMVRSARLVPGHSAADAAK